VARSPHRLDNFTRNIFVRQKLRHGYTGNGYTCSCFNASAA
jgi:hypothetical protein